MTQEMYCKCCNERTDHSIENKQTPFTYLEIISCDECGDTVYKEV